jgi:hypothetical protein
MPTMTIDCPTIGNRTFPPSVTPAKAGAQDATDTGLTRGNMGPDVRRDDDRPTRSPGPGPGPMGVAAIRCAVDWVRARDTGAEAPGEEPA